MTLWTRTTAWSLEKRWNEKLERVAQLEKAFAQAEQEAQWELSADEWKAIGQLSCDLPAIWNAATTTNQDRKRLLQMAMDSVQLDGVHTRVHTPGHIELQIRWRSGTISSLIVKRPVPGEWSLKTPSQAVSKIHSLAGLQTYPEIAAHLNRKGLRTAFGRPFTDQTVGYICRRDGIARAGKRLKAGAPNPGSGPDSEEVKP
jgi:hypothetical protein